MVLTRLSLLLNPIFILKKNRFLLVRWNLFQESLDLSYVVKGNKAKMPFLIFTDTDDCSGIYLLSNLY